MTENATSIIAEQRNIDPLQASARYEDHIMSSKEAAAYLKTTTEQMVRLRRSGKGPAFAQVGHLIRYRKSVVDLWLASQTKTPSK